MAQGAANPDLVSAYPAPIRARPRTFLVGLDTSEFEDRISPTNTSYIPFYNSTRLYECPRLPCPRKCFCNSFRFRPPPVNGLGSFKTPPF